MTSSKRGWNTRQANCMQSKPSTEGRTGGLWQGSRTEKIEDHESRTYKQFRFPDSRK